MKNILLLINIIMIFGCKSATELESTSKKSADITEFNDFYSYFSEEPINGVSIKEEKTMWGHWDVEVKDDYTAKRGQQKIIEKEFNIIILENDYTALTLLPEYGGRLLSYYFKPTKHEQLYQNPVGTPYGFSEGNFYYNWLMVYGGIFPTFPEPEHGKTWLVPWEYEITESEDSASVKMWYTDDKPRPPGAPGSFNNRTTGLTCVVTYTLYSDSTVAQMDVKIINDKDKDVKYEYWTCLTLAPGSNPNDTKTTSGAEILIPTDEVTVAWSPGAWLGSYGDVTSFDKYKKLEDWQDMGNLYVYPKMEKNWYGVINHDNQEAILRIGDNSKTPGLKLWSWGFDQGMAVDPETDSINGARPYVELWSGTSLQFFSDAIIDANSELSWTENYFPTVGMDNVTYANSHGAINVDGNTNQIYMTKPDVEYKVIIESNGNTVSTEVYTQDPSTAFNFESDLIDANAYRIKITLSDVELISFDFTKK